jgi:protein-tyrosine phosphatase
MTIARPVPASYWLNDGMLLAGEYPGASDRAETRQKVAKFVDAGIRTFVNLTESSEPLTAYDDVLHDLSEERGLEMKHLRFAIRDAGVPSGRDLMTRILAAIRDEIAAGRPVYVHCWGGIGRTGTVIGCWLVDEGLDGTAALERIAELRSDTPDRRRRSPETDEQCRFIREWKSGDPV